MCISHSVGKGLRNERTDVTVVQVLLDMNCGAPLSYDPVQVDGVFGDETIRGIKDFQRACGLAVDGQIDPAGTTLRRLTDGIPAEFGALALQGIMTAASPRDVATFCQPLDLTMRLYGIDTALRRAHFLAQVGHESGALRYEEELASGDAYEGRADLGNTEPGDGRRFKGRGLIQLTGRANYIAYGAARGDDFTQGDTPSRIAEDPELAADVAGWFWAQKKLNALADADNVRAVTRRINGGYNGLADRIEYLARAKFFLRV
jgi:putative chitinase